MDDVIHGRVTDEKSPRPMHGSRRWQYSLRGLMTSMAVVSLYLAACVSLVRDLGSRDFLAAAVAVPAMLIGMFLGIIGGNYWSRRRRGRKLIRMRYRYQGRLAWFSPLLVPIFALGYVTAENLLVGQPPSKDALLLRHLARTVLLFWTVQSACFALWTTRHSLTLCENGINFRGGGFAPWHKIDRRVAMPFDHDGHLVIRYPAASIVAIVPPEQRDAVDAILKEKLVSSTDAQNRRLPL